MMLSAREVSSSIPFLPTRAAINIWHKLSDYAGGLSLAQIDNKVNASNDLIQATGASQASTLANARNSKTAAVFNGTSSNYTYESNAEINNANNVTIAVAFMLTALGSRYTLFSTRETNANGQWNLELGTVGSVTNGVSITGPNTIVVQVNNCLVVNTPYILVYRRTGSIHSIRLNGIEQTLISTTPAYNFLTFNNLKRVGATNQALTALSLYFQGQLYEMIDSNAYFPTPTVILLENYLHNEWGI